MASIETDEFGKCLDLWQARNFLNRQRVSVLSVKGALVFTYPEQEERKVLPVWIHGKGFYYPEIELRRDYVKPAPEVILD